jgi:O-antigen chain-terminating methyltransferase
MSDLSAITDRLRSIGEELESLSSQIKAGEPRPQSPTLKGRIGGAIKRRLYRLLWWHCSQMNAAVVLISRWMHEEKKAIEAIRQGYEQGIQNADHRINQTAAAAANSLRVAELAQRLATDSSGSAQLAASVSELTRKFDAESIHTRQLATNLSELRQELDAENVQARQLAASLSELMQEIEAENVQTRQLAARFSELAQKVDVESNQTRHLHARISDLGLFTQQTRASLSIQDRRLAVLIEESRKRLPAAPPSQRLQEMLNEETQHKYDSLYAAFEDVFRGSREEIKSRQSVYLPLLKEHKVGSSAMPLLDLGCGRGEWLELLGEQGFEARGVDSNDEMIERCKSAGLSIESGDSLAYLKSQPDECVGAVTAFHMVEHMPFDVVLVLIDESLRVLKPGGLLILETPNPANFLVGAYTFHLDPTHLKPVPSPLLKFFVEARGFCGVEVRDLHPYPQAVRLPEDGGIASRFNDSLYGPQDYAVIGRKP